MTGNIEGKIGSVVLQHNKSDFWAEPMGSIISHKSGACSVSEEREKEDRQPNLERTHGGSDTQHPWDTLGTLPKGELQDPHALLRLRESMNTERRVLTNCCAGQRARAAARGATHYPEAGS